MEELPSQDPATNAPRPRNLGLLPSGFWRRHGPKVAIGFVLVVSLAIVGSVIEASFPVEDVDPERAQLGVEHLIAKDAWRRTDLRAAVDDPRTGTWVPTPSAPQETTRPHLYGGHATLLSAEFVPAMTLGAVYDFKLNAIGEGTVPPNAFVAFARHPTTAFRDGEDPGIVARAPVKFHTTFFDQHDRLYVSVRYVARASDVGQPLYLWLVSRGGTQETAVGWEPYRGTVYPPVDSALTVARAKRGVKNALMGSVGVVGVALVVSPVLIQLWALTLLLVHRKRETLVRGILPVAVFVLAVSAAPLYELFAFSVVSTEEWQGQRGPGIWRYFWTGPRASLWMLWGAFAGAFLGLVAIRGEHIKRQAIAVLVLGARVLVSLGFTVGAAAAAHLSFLALVPLLAAAIDLVWVERLWQGLARRERKGFETSRLLAGSAWIFGWVATLVAQYEKARNTYSELPAEMPGGCFVVSAAAKGHRRVVGSRPGADGRPENDQLVTLRRFEHTLATSHPELHHPLRCIYNCVGPRVARRLDRPWKADLAYLMLKPLEWTAAPVLRSLAAKRPRNR